MDSSLFASAALGLATSAALIVAIGAQNAFVLRQGLRREHVGAVVLFCAAADALLMAAGVLGSAWAAARLPWLAPWLRGVALVFLLGYGLLALRRAIRPHDGLHAAAPGLASRSAVLAQAAAFTLLNPHVYLDTVLLVGGLGAAQPTPAARAAFVLGASAASLGWFSLIGFGAARLAPKLAGPRLWRGLDALTGLLMLGLAATLL